MEVRGCGKHSAVYIRQSVEEYSENYYICTRESRTRPAPSEFPQDRKGARVGGCSGAMYGAFPFLLPFGQRKRESWAGAARRPPLVYPSVAARHLPVGECGCAKLRRRQSWAGAARRPPLVYPSVAARHLPVGECGFAKLRRRQSCFGFLPKTSLTLVTRRCCGLVYCLATWKLCLLPHEWRFLQS